MGHPHHQHHNRRHHRSGGWSGRPYPYPYPYPYPIDFGPPIEVVVPVQVPTPVQADPLPDGYCGGPKPHALCPERAVTSAVRYGAPIGAAVGAVLAKNDKVTGAMAGAAFGALITWFAGSGLWWR